MAWPGFLTTQAGGVLLAVKLQPRASRNAICEPLGNELRIKVTAPPVDAAANDALMRLLAEQLGCPRNRVELLRGHTSRHKTVKLHGFTPGARPVETDTQLRRITLQRFNASTIQQFNDSPLDDCKPNSRLFNCAR
jgi:uncharacterized protein